MQQNLSNCKCYRQMTKVMKKTKITHKNRQLQLYIKEVYEGLFAQIIAKWPLPHLDICQRS